MLRYVHAILLTKKSFVPKLNSKIKTLDEHLLIKQSPLKSEAAICLKMIDTFALEEISLCLKIVGMW